MTVKDKNMNIKVAFAAINKFYITISFNILRTGNTFEAQLKYLIIKFK